MNKNQCKEGEMPKISLLKFQEDWKLRIVSVKIYPQQICFQNQTHWYQIFFVESFIVEKICHEHWTMYYFFMKRKFLKKCYDVTFIKYHVCINKNAFTIKPIHKKIFYTFTFYLIFRMWKKSTILNSYFDGVVQN